MWTSRNLSSKLALGLVTLVVLVGIGIWYATEHVLPYSPIRPHRVTREEIAKYYSGNASPSSLGLKYHDLNVVVDDSIQLRGWFIYAHASKPRGTVILLHGIASCKEAMLIVANSLVHHGYNCIVYDQRANGESGGINCTFGYFEKHDVSRIIDQAIQQFRNVEPIAILGNSFGAAVSLQAMAIDGRIRCGIIENSFATLREIFHDYFKRMFGVRLDFVVDNALIHSERIAHFNVDEVKPEESARLITQPVLVVHGTDDEHISIEYGRRIFSNIASTNKEWFPVQGASHNNLNSVGGKAYQEKIMDFLNKNLRD